VIFPSLRKKGLLVATSLFAITGVNAVNADSFESLTRKAPFAKTNLIANTGSSDNSQDLYFPRTHLENNYDCSFYNQFSSDNCLKYNKSYQPTNRIEKYVQRGAIYLSKFVPLLNNRSKGSDYSNLIVDDSKSLMTDSSNRLINSSLNNNIKKIPFFAQTTIALNVGGSDSLGNISIDSLMKLKEFDYDQEGDLKTLFFSQARFSTDFNGDGSTTNLGLGIRKRPNEESLVGGNVFLDYRITEYSRSYARIGLGGEYLWKNLELRNNWYISATNKQSITIGGTEYTERVVPGWDVEIGYRLPDYPELAFYIRGFNWDYKDTQDNSGVEGSINWQATSHLNLEAWISNEISANEVHSNTALPRLDETFVGLRIKITGEGINFGKQSYKQNMLAQMTQPVRRRYEVLLERSTGWSNRAKGS
tara:strand:- start:1456 stop:2712 length:1257 start_codon:yes stop_codon:yes gene_type:complete